MSTPFHTKYRPKTLSEVVGHESVVTTLRGYIKTGKFPSAIALFGPTSVGKTTLARAFAADVLQCDPRGNPDYTEVNGSAERTIDDMRALIQEARLRPTGGRRRIVVLDEAQGTLSNAAAAAAILKPLETPVPTTTWILGSMDPEKFAASSNGRAMLTRCIQFHLQKPSQKDLMAQLMRIRKGEGMKYVTRDVANTIVENCNGQMRTLSNMMESLAGYYDGLDEQPGALTPDDVQTVLRVGDTEDDAVAVRLLIAVYACKLGAAQKEVLNISDAFGTLNRLLNLHWAVFNNTVLNGQRHPAIWMTKPAVVLADQLGSLFSEQSLERPAQLARLASVQASLTELKSRAQAFAVPELMAISAWAVNTINQLKS